ncbi:MAG: K+/H+ antiporter subunit F [Sphingomonadaceae bacterium]|uniref:K+/H+ antiporter subunit F n=1 Tax=Thermaurantiacus sp. TaxID=2820283 RepID=UPI00298F22B4|nr:K+/H+ antiporter subunit F [Thermaurantiacus sp.]MCS6987619.1 K+/H+ antiporter subunit F [Sphingomonadaceae bacterium]MDW8415220.1 K+/H+ antiporter subunit F [Thermaurantiacus sp.]
MLSLALPLAVALVALAMALNLVRLVLGPQLVDRILALDTLNVNAIGLVVMLGLLLGTKAYLEAALILAMMGFVGTVALAKYLLSGDLIE